MFEQMKEIIRNYVQVADEDIHEDSRFVEDLGFNSYEFMCLVGEVEDAVSYTHLDVYKRQE